jgi:nucleotide-binding universal stress UspA family protein
MTKILLPVDGSENCARAIRYVISRTKAGASITLHLLNVQPPFPRLVSDAVPAKEIESYHQEQGGEALKSAEKLLDAAGVRYVAHIAVGEPAETIADYAKQQNIDEIVMGTRGMGSVANLLLGSCALKVVHLAEVPVTLVK